MLGAKQLLISLSVMSLKPLKACQEALLYTPAVYKDNRRGPGIHREVGESSLTGHPPRSTLDRKGGRSPSAEAYTPFVSSS